MTEDTKALVEKMRTVHPEKGVAYRISNIWQDGRRIEIWEPATNDLVLFFALATLGGPSKGSVEIRVPLPIFDEHGVFLPSAGMFERLTMMHDVAVKAAMEDMREPKIALPSPWIR